MALAPGGWTRPSACPGWEVGDVVAHLSMNASLYSKAVERGLRGDTTLPGAAPRPEGGPADDEIREWAISYRQRQGDGLLERFDANNRRFAELLAGVHGSDWDRPAPYISGLFPLHRMVDLRIIEVALHPWDIRSPDDAEARISGQAVEALAEALPAALGRIFERGGWAGGHLRVRFELSGAGGGVWDIAADGQGIRAGPGRGEAQDVVACGGQDFVLLMYGRVALQRVIEEGRAVISGGGEAVNELGKWIGGY